MIAVVLFLGADVNLNVVAMALAGFSDERNTMWRETSSRLCRQLGDAYLRRMFTFLTGEGDNIEEILVGFPRIYDTYPIYWVAVDLCTSCKC